MAACRQLLIQRSQSSEEGRVGEDKASGLVAVVLAWGLVKTPREGC